MRAAWLTDIHLDHIGGELERFLRQLAETEADCFLLTGDIAQAPSIRSCLLHMDLLLGRDIYFVLGNHDYYFGSIAGVRAGVRRLCGASKRLHWLGGCGALQLSPGTAIVGDDGWGDARLGNVGNTPVMLNDFRLIRELCGLARAERNRKLNALGRRAARHLASALPEALARAEHVLVLTHVPPFAAAAQGAELPDGDDWLPYFACEATGQVLAEAMRANPDKRMTVLCGHTHSRAEVQILPNLAVFTGAADYGRPAVQCVFEWE